MHHKHALLICAFKRNKPHARTQDRFADRLCVCRVILLTLHKWLHISWRDKSDRVPERTQLPPPILRRSAGLHADQARREASKIADDVRSAELPPNIHLTV